MHHDYDSMFSSHQGKAAKRQANADLLADTLWRYVQPKSVIDLGCGMGFFLKACADRGAEIRGIDGEWSKDVAPVVAKSALSYADLNQPVKLRKRHDLAASIEVAEHLLPERSESFVADLCKLSDTVLFSAGIPHQGGAGHINLRYQHEWAEIFAEQGYACFDPIRRRMAAMGDIYPWFAQNILLYIKDGTAIDPLLDEHRIAPQAASYVGLTLYHRRERNLARRLRKARMEAKLAKAGEG
ncbi:hypothetical protein [Alterinioella nitratireducens]|uniref:hypothetical protein n=1 Tax=Alterinioella nitratireducens TaxID=2735915 RepID=UPI004057D8C2